MTRAARRACVWSVAVGLAGVGLALAIGPSAMAIVYGEEYRTGSLALALLAGGVGAYLAAATLSQLLLALDRARVAAATWAFAAGLFMAAYVAIDGTELERIGGAFALASSAAALVLGLVVFRFARRAPSEALTQEAPSLTL